MAKITFQDALPRRSMYEDAKAKPAASRAKPQPATDITGLVSRITDDNRHDEATPSPHVVQPCSSVPYGDWITRIGLTAVDAATLLGVTRQSTYAWSKPDGEAPLHVRQRLALIEYVGLDVARTIFSGLDEAE